MGEPSKIIGIEIIQSSNKICIFQKYNIKFILIRQGLEEANPVTTLLDPKIKLEPNPEGNKGDRSNAYAQLLEELQFISNATCPNITYTVNKLASYIANPHMQHQTVLTYILHYLSGTRDYGITYKYIKDSIPTFHGFTNATFANREDRKSISGYVIIMVNSTIMWKSRKEGITVQSTTEAKFVALWEGSQEAQWLRNLH